ncbi:hypothetical protein [Cerasicoccus maritimus]|uniref:hypothetical protein n=1 Tax=Cerasicoccus maritimus TaxID=490089 RepID=UPI0028528333|nr:hypothetical protein [Cerasicoccus maritimus]
MKALLPIILTSAVALSAQARIIFEDNFESYSVGQSIDGKGGWVADESYKIVKTADGKGVFSGRTVADAAITHAIETQERTFYIGVDVDFSLSASNFYWIAAANGKGPDNTAGAIFNARDGKPLIAARIRKDSKKTKTGRPAPYDVPARLVIEISSYGEKYSSTIWINPTSTSDTPIQTVTSALGVSELNTFFARRGSVSHSAMTMDNLIIATNFDEALNAK